MTIKRKPQGLGNISRKHSEYAHNLLDAYEVSAQKARRLAHEGKCDGHSGAVYEAMYAAWLRGQAEAHANSGRVPAYVAGRRLRSQFWEGGPGIAWRDAMEYVAGRCGCRNR